MENFEEFEKLLGSQNPLFKVIKARGFTKPSEIQERSIPLILEGKDVIAGASTGSGKTLAFAVGIAKNVQKDFGIQALVLTPTRELAEQVGIELEKFSAEKDLKVAIVYGGVSLVNQVKELEYCDIVVGTPGRILDHLSRNSIDLSRINTLVLDEADRMLDMGFLEDVDNIIKNCNIHRQTMLFSATITQDVIRLSEKYMKNPLEVSATSQVDPSKLEQVYYDIGDNLKYSLLKHLLENEQSKLVLVFCNTRTNVDFVANNLKFMGIEALPLHGGYSQDKRNKILELFHSKKIRVLVATDVAARGLDIKGISHVYNYDIPPTKEEYTHRIGRTARAGKEGKAVNILTSRDYENFRNVNKGDFKITRMETPYIQRVRIRWMPEKREERMHRRSSMRHMRDNPDDKHHESKRESSHYGNRNRPRNSFPKRDFHNKARNRY